MDGCFPAVVGPLFASTGMRREICDTGVVEPPWTAGTQWRHWMYPRSGHATPYFWMNLVEQPAGQGRVHLVSIAVLGGGARKSLVWIR